MALHSNFPTSPYAPLIPEQRWFPADEAMRATAYEKLLPPLVAKVRKEVYAWRNNGYAGASQTSVALLRHWFESEHLNESADGSLSAFRYYYLVNSIGHTRGLKKRTNQWPVLFNRCKILFHSFLQRLVFPQWLFRCSILLEMVPHEFIRV